MGNKDTSKNWLEWLVTIISGILVLATFAFLTFQLIKNEQSPPNLSVSLGEVIEKDGGYSLRVSVKNQGTETAENIVIEIYSNAKNSVERGQVRFQYLPGKSTVKGWVSFSEKPETNLLKSKVLGYVTP